MASITSHLTPAEKLEYDDARFDVRHHRTYVRAAQNKIRKLKNLARKRAAKTTTKVDAR